MKEYVLTTSKQGWNHVLTIKKAEKVIFGLCPTQKVPCALRISFESEPKTDLYADDVYAYICVSPQTPMGEQMVRRGHKMRVDLFQPEEEPTGGHLLIE